MYLRNFGGFSMEKKFYSLPPIGFNYNALSPYISEEQLKIHHTKHHQAYVDNANAILKKLDDAAQSGADVDIKTLSKELSFNLGGHTMHSYFWETLAPPGKGGDKPSGQLADAIAKDFGSFERFKKEFTQAAVGVEGSGPEGAARCRARLSSSRVASRIRDRVSSV